MTKAATRIFSLSFFLFVVLACNENKATPKNDFVIAEGQMPNLTKDKDGNLHLIYGTGDSIMYTWSHDQGNSFTAPAVVAVLPKLFSFATRGPQIAAGTNGIIVTACTSLGNIFSYFKENGTWKQGTKVNDADTVAKEGLMALSADGENAFAVWLDIRNNGGKGQRIFGAKSSDGGRSWGKNILVYTSPDKTVCECCKPSVVVRGNNVYVMFRNWLNGNRDLYVIQSANGGDSFGQAQKLGMGSWKLNGCPMDGGNLAINNNGAIQTVWKRDAKIYAAMPGMPEQEMGEGRGCTIETADNKTVYAWTEKGEVVFVKANGQKESLGKGMQPVLKALDNEHVICVWENEKHIHAAVLEL
jgi:hypothetical protein